MFRVGAGFLKENMITHLYTRTDNFHRKIIKEVLERTHSAALSAQELGISVPTFQAKVKMLDIQHTTKTCFECARIERARKVERMKNNGRGK
jgi:DNA-binding NtrC family response regulator